MMCVQAVLTKMKAINHLLYILLCKQQVPMMPHHIIFSMLKPAARQDKQWDSIRKGLSKCKCLNYIHEIQ